jgi:molecular chaperone IbpA
MHIEEVPGGGYPPYDIERRDYNLYRIVVGVWGYAAHELGVREDEGELIITGITGALTGDVEMIRRLIEPRFERRFRLHGGFRLDCWRLDGSLLMIEVRRDTTVPVEAELPPRRVDSAAELVPELAA